MRHVRRRALKIVLFGALLAVLWTVVVMAFGERGRQFWGPGLGAPAVPLLIGLVELVSGRTFRELAQRWDELAGWQRGVLGLVIVALATGFFVVVFGMYVVAVT